MFEWFVGLFVGRAIHPRVGGGGEGRNGGPTKPNPPVCWLGGGALVPHANTAWGYGWRRCERGSLAGLYRAIHTPPSTRTSVSAIPDIGQPVSSPIPFGPHLKAVAC